MFLCLPLLLSPLWERQFLPVYSWVLIVDPPAPFTQQSPQWAGDRDTGCDAVSNAQFPAVPPLYCSAGLSNLL